MIYDNSAVSEGSYIQRNVFIGVPSQNYLSQEEAEWPKTLISRNALLRTGTVIYCGVVIGENFKTGHNVLIRENTTIGNNVMVGSNAVVEGFTIIGDNVRIQSSVFIPLYTFIGDDVFIGPCVVFTNDKYPISADLKGPAVGKGAILGANSTILPGIVIGEKAIVAAGSVVTKDVPPFTMALGAPASIRPLPRVFAVHLGQIPSTQKARENAREVPLDIIRKGNNKPAVSDVL